MGIALWLRLPTNDLKLFTALIVAFALAIPQLHERRRLSRRKAGSGKGGAGQ